MSFFAPQNPGIGGLDELTNAEEIFLVTLAGLSYADGDILYYNGSSLQRLPKGTNGEVLTLVSGLPSWEPASGGAGSTAWGLITGTLSDQTDLQTALDAKQATLVSGTNIKTINGNSILGSGNLSITSSAAWGSITGTLSSQTDLQTALDGKANTSHTHAISDVTNLQTSLDAKVDENAAIVAATKTKITYDTKGLVTAGADATTADISDSTNRRYVTDAQLTVIGNTSGTNTGDQTSIAGITGTKAQFNTALTDGDFLFVGDVTQYTNEDAQDAVGLMVDSTLVYVDATPLLTRAALTGAITASQGSNTTSLGSFTKAQLDAAVSDGNVMYVGDAPTAHTHTASEVTDFNTAADARIAAASINALSDVVISTPSTGQVLKYNGTNWVNDTDATGGGGVSDGDKGDITVSASGATWTIDNNAVTFAKMQSITDGRLLGASGGTAIEEITVGSGLSLSGNTLSATGGGGGTSLGLVMATAQGYNMV